MAVTVVMVMAATVTAVMAIMAVTAMVTAVTAMVTADMDTATATATTNIGTAIGTAMAAGGGTTAGTAGAASAGCKRPRVGSGPATRRFHVRGVGPIGRRLSRLKRNSIAFQRLLPRLAANILGRQSKFSGLIRPRDCTTEKDWLRSSTSASIKEFPAGTILLSEGETSGRLYILAEGRIEVLRGDTEVAVVDDAGAVFGEMSVLLNRPHTARVRAKSPVRVYVFDDAASFLKSNPEIAFFLGRLLAERLNAATTYLVDLKRQFEGHGNHLGMVGEVLETLIHQQHEDFTLGPKRETDPLRLREAGGRREKQISSTRLFVRSPTRTENHKVRQRKIHGEADGDRNKLGS